jgi:sugar lactone lactonase YvrE
VKEYASQVCTTQSYVLGEGVRYDEVRGELCWADINGGMLIRAHARGPEIEIVARHTVEGLLSSFAPYADRDQGFLVARNQSLARLGLDGTLETLAAPRRPDEGAWWFNDGAADPWGRFWVGTIGAGVEVGHGHLYRLGREGLMTVDSGFTISNGLGWSRNGRTMYHVDSGPGIIYRLELSAEGEVQDRKIFDQLSPDEGTPDGLCMDAEDCFWVAVWGGSEVRRYAPTGEVVARVTVPVSQPSCCALGGTDRTILYVTTATEDLDEATIAREVDGGRLFCAEVDVPGVDLAGYRPEAP